jgi:hypothetical protein
MLQREVFWTSEPFGYAVVDGLFRTDLLERVADSFPSSEDSGWQRFQNGNEVKLGGTETMLTADAHEYLDVIAKNVTWFSELTGIPELSMELEGGGYHLIPPGGRLAMHTDFNRSRKSGLHRRLNVLTYLNKDWEDEGGHLLLGADLAIDVAPEFGRTVIFETSDKSWHGHPIPAQRWRKSIAAYLFSPEQPDGYTRDHSTIFLGA